jgi:hypothetical protein
MESSPNDNNTDTNQPALDENLQEVYELKIVAREMLLGSELISRPVQIEIEDIINKIHVEKHNLILGLADYLRKKNPKIFDVDHLTKQGHEIGKSASIDALGLSKEDLALLEWFQQVRE